MTGKTFKELGFKAGDKVRCTLSKFSDIYPVDSTFTLVEDKTEWGPTIEVNGLSWLGTEGDWELVPQIKLEVGKRYITHVGYVTTPMEYREGSNDWLANVPDQPYGPNNMHTERLYHEDGTHAFRDKSVDIVAEYKGMKLSDLNLQPGDKVAITKVYKKGAWFMPPHGEYKEVDSRGCWFGIPKNGHDEVEGEFDMIRKVQESGNTTKTYEIGKWYSWDGGECPLPVGTRYAVVRQGKSCYRDISYASHIVQGDSFTQGLWDHTNDKYVDIIRFKVLEYPTKRVPATRETTVYTDTSQVTKYEEGTVEIDPQIKPETFKGED